MKKILLLSLLACTGFLQGCFSPPPLEIELPDHQPKLSVISQVIPDRTMFVQVSKSFSALTPDRDSLAQDSSFLASLLVEHAYVTISFAGQTHQLRHLGYGIYGSTDILQVADQDYTLYVKDSVSGLECTSTSRMLPRVQFDPDSVKVQYEINGVETKIFVKYAFDDPPGQNYYLLDYTPLDSFAPNPNRSPFNFGSNSNKFQLLTDKEIANGHLSAKMRLNNVRTGMDVVFSLTNISEDYYKYLTTFKKTGSLFNQLTGEPIGFPTNVVNGYGFFTTHNPDLRVLHL